MTILRTSDARGPYDAGVLCKIVGRGIRQDQLAAETQSKLQMSLSSGRRENHFERERGKGKEREKEDQSSIVLPTLF